MKPVTWQQIISPSRRARVVEKRSAICVSLRRKFQGMTLADIGEIMGGRSPATIHHEINLYYRRAK